MRCAHASLHLLAVLVAACLLGCEPPLPKEARVRRVVDGDTIQLADGRLLRYIGINAPEVRRRVAGRWVEAPEPFGLAASKANRQLVEGRTVRLEYDVQTHDRFGRLLAYVYVDEAMVNEELVREGLAEPLVIRPDVKYAERFRELADEARREHRGRWASR